MNRIFRLPPQLLLIIVAIVPFIFYVWTLPGTFVAMADAAEFAVAIMTNGIAHPPGYPLYLLIGKLATLLPLQNKLWLINATSALFSSLTSYFVALIIFRFTKSIPSSIFASFCLGLSALFWKYSLVSEIFTLNSFFLSLLIFLGLTSQGVSGFMGLSFLLGLALTNHQTIGLTYPLILYLMWKRKLLPTRINYWLLGLVCFGFGFTPYYYLYWLGKAHPLQIFGDTQSLWGVFDIITRKAYGTFVLVAGDQQYALPSLGHQVFAYLTTTSKEFTLFGMGLSLLGIGLLLKRKLGLGLMLVFVYLLSGIFFFVYAGIHLGNQLYLTISERFLILPNTLFVIALGLGHYNLFSFIKQKIPVGKNYLFHAFMGFSFALPVVLFLSNFSNNDLSQNVFAQQIAEDAFLNTPENSIMLVTGDTPIPSIIYAQQVEKKRLDIAIIVPEFFKQKKTPWYWTHLEYHYPDLILPDRHLEHEALLADFITKNLPKRPIVSVGRLTQGEIGLPIPNKRIGIVGQFLPELPELVDLTEYEREIEYAFTQLKNVHPLKNYPIESIEATILDLYARPYKFLAGGYEDNGQIDEAIHAYKKALEITPVNYPIYRELAKLYEKKGDKKTAYQMLSKYIKSNPYEKDIPLMQEYLETLK